MKLPLLAASALGLCNTALGLSTPFAPRDRLLLRPSDPDPQTRTRSGASSASSLQWQHSQVGGGMRDVMEASKSKVPLQLAVMSKCPDAQVCEIVFDRVLDYVGGLVQPELVYIGSLNSSSPYGVTCMHGDSECRGNVQQLCVAKYWTGPSGEVNPWADWWNFVQCVNYGPTSRIGDDALAKSCARVVGHQWDDTITNCVTSSEGVELLRDSVRKAQAMEVTKSCTIVINGEAVCVHDGTWKQCPEGHEVGDFTRQIRAEWKKLNSAASADEGDERKL